MKYFFCFMFIVGCAKSQTLVVAEPDDYPIYEEYVANLDTDQKLEPDESSMYKDVYEGDTVPYDGVLMNESAAKNVSNLSVEYDALYETNEVIKKHSSDVIKDLEKGLIMTSDEYRLYREAVEKNRNSWIERNKASISFIFGVVLGSALCISAGVVWSKIDQ